MKTKICSTCKKRKLTRYFNFSNKKKNILRTACKTCTRKEFNTHYKNHKNKKKIIKKVIKRNKYFRIKFFELKKNYFCKLCGEKELCCLEFHHLDPNQKDFNLSHYANFGWKRVIEEINKCICLCSNCHKKVHAKILTI